jgi:hypothetical protein
MKWRKLKRISFEVFTLFQFVTASAVFPIERELQLQCPPNTIESFNAPSDLEIQESPYAFLSVGRQARAFLGTIRRKKKEYYQDVLDKMIMYSCDVEQEEQNRCVPESSEFAAKNWNNECIIAAGYSCDIGFCERTSSCFWDNVSSGEVRKSRFTKDQYSKAKEQLIGLTKGSYAGNLALPTIIGISVSAAIFLLWLIYFALRYCCCCLWRSCALCKPCSPIPKEEGYNVCFQWIIPTFLYIGSFLGLMISGFIALIGNHDINDAATSCFAYVSLLLENAGSFLNESSLPLQTLTSIVTSAAIDAFNIIDGTEYVRVTANRIIQSFGDLLSLHVLGLDGNEGALIDVENAFVANVEPVVDQIQGMLDTLESDIYDGSNLINSTLTGVVSQINSFVENINVWENDVAKYEGEEFETRPLRQAAILSCFVIGGTICLVGLVGIIASKRSKESRLAAMTNLAGIFSALLGTACLVLASLTLFVSLVWHDACEISALVVNDFEPVLGETLAKGATAIFSGSNLAVAFNLTDRIDFENKLNEGLSQIENVNITEQFDLVLSPLKDIQTSVVDNVKATSFLALSSIFEVGIPGVCEFSYLWKEDDFLEPWNRSSMITSWSLNMTGLPASEERIGNESPEEYINRLYSIAGKCDSSAGDCCLNEDCSRQIEDSCNTGTNCKREAVCEAASQTIRMSFEKWHDANRMSANLGAVCPQDLTCPTAEFQSRGNQETVLGLVSSYGDNITETAGNLINIANTTVGDAMEQVRIFLCNMNITFVANGYNQVRDEICETMLGGFSQINFGFWALGIWLQSIAILSHVLAIRLRGYTKSEASERLKESSFKSDGLMVSVTDFA